MNRETRLGASPLPWLGSLWVTLRVTTVCVQGPCVTSTLHLPLTELSPSLPPHTAPSFPWIRARLLINVIYVPSTGLVAPVSLKTQAAPGHISLGVHVTPGAPEGQMRKPRV